MTALLSLPRLSRRIHRARNGFSGALSPANADAARRWLRAALARGALSPAECVATLRRGDRAAAELASAAARASLTTPAIPHPPLRVAPDRPTVAKALRWLVHAGILGPEALRATLADALAPSEAVQRCFAEAEQRAADAVAALCAPFVTPFQPFWRLHLTTIDDADGRDDHLAFAVELQVAPFLTMPLTSPAFAHVGPRIAAFNAKTHVTGVQAPDDRNPHYGWHYEEALEDLAVQQATAASFDEAVDAVCEAVGVDPDTLRDLAAVTKALKAGHVAQGPLDSSAIEVLAAIDRLTAALPTCAGFQWVHQDDTDYLMVAPAIFAAPVLTDIAMDDLEACAGSAGDDCGAIRFPSAPTSDSLYSLYLELYLHSALFAHVDYLA